MDVANATLITGIVVAVITYVISPWVQERVKERRKNDPALGWKTAVANLQLQVTEQDKRIGVLEAEVQRLEDDNATKTATITKLERIIEDQSNMILARDARIGQLLKIFKASTGQDPPSPDPAFAYWLRTDIMDTGGHNHDRYRR